MLSGWPIHPWLAHTRLPQHISALGLCICGLFPCCASQGRISHDISVNVDGQPTELHLLPFHVSRVVWHVRDPAQGRFCVPMIAFCNKCLVRDRRACHY
eukprot:2806088-Alexandrium_andersonii.AAC.1